LIFIASCEILNYMVKYRTLDGGNPFGAPKVVKSDGVGNDVDGSPATGYSIVNASDLAAAAVLAKGCPMLVDSPSSTVEVYEAFPM
jgi:hypothetical protein